MKYLFLFIIFNISCYGQKSNISILDSLITESIINSINNNLLIDSLDYNLTIHDNFNTRIFESNTQSLLLENNISLNKNSKNKLSYSLELIDLNYKLLDNKINRNLTVNISNSLNNKINNYNISYNDTINRNEINNIQTKEIDYLYKTIPKRKESKVNKYLKPILIVLSAAASVYLLFSVRSN